MFPGTPTAPPIMVTDRILARSAAPPRRRTAASSVGGPSVTTSTRPGADWSAARNTCSPDPAGGRAGLAGRGSPQRLSAAVAPRFREGVSPLQRPRPSAADRNVRLAGQRGERERVRRAPGTAGLAVTVDHDRGHLHVGAAKQVQERHRVRGVHVGLDDDVPGNGACRGGCSGRSPRSRTEGHRNREQQQRRDQQVPGAGRSSPDSHAKPWCHRCSFRSGTAIAVEWCHLARPPPKAAPGASRSPGPVFGNVP